MGKNRFLANMAVALVCLVTSSGGAWAASPTPTDEPAILAAVDRFMLAVGSKDVADMAAAQMADGMTYSWRPKEGGGMHVVGRSNAYWVDPKNKDGRSFRERYWSPTVLARGGIAVVWAPYEFWIDGQTHHCGIDSFHLVKADDGWRVANAMWTVEPNACDELRPKDASALRPADPAK